MQIRYKNGNNSFGMRAAIAKRFSGDAAPELFRFFRISIGSGCEACACLGGAQRRRLVSKMSHIFMDTIYLCGKQQEKKNACRSCK